MNMFDFLIGVDMSMHVVGVLPDKCTRQEGS